MNHQVLVDNTDAFQECMMSILEEGGLKVLRRRFPSIAFTVQEEVNQRLKKRERSLEQANFYLAGQRLTHYLF